MPVSINLVSCCINVFLKLLVWHKPIILLCPSKYQEKFSSHITILDIIHRLFTASIFYQCKRCISLCIVSKSKHLGKNVSNVEKKKSPYKNREEASDNSIMRGALVIEI